MQSHLHIDWLSITFPIPRGASAEQYDDIQYFRQQIAYNLTRDKSVWRTAKPLFGYTSAYQSGYGTLVMYGKQEMGVHVQYSGQALYMLDINGVEADDIIRNAVSLGARATRADIALDIYNGVSGADSFTNAVKLGKAITSSKTWKNLENEAGGKTCYIGARSSERMVRVYDKKAERASQFIEVSSDSWIRVEAELKGDRAKDFMNACKDNELLDVMRAHLKGAIDFPTIKDWNEALNFDHAVVQPTETKRKDTKTRHWLMSVVANTLANECADDIDFLAKFQTEVYTLIEQKAGKRRTS